MAMKNIQKAKDILNKNMSKLHLIAKELFENEKIEIHIFNDPCDLTDKTENRQGRPESR